MNCLFAKQLTGDQLRSFIWLYFLLTIYGCARHVAADVIVNPRTFKIEIPYEPGTDGIVIDTYWGKHKYRLLWDNHSPTWASGKIIHGNEAVSKSKYLAYQTTTAEGTPIKGDVYMCDSILVGGIAFKGVAFYEISGKRDGVIGETS